jgi:hypothetical protein
VLLPEPQQAAHKDYGENDQRVDGVMQEEREPCGKQEKDDDRALELPQQERESIRSGTWLEDVGTTAGEPAPRLIAAQSFPVCSQLLEHPGCRDAPEGRRRLFHALFLSFLPIVPHALPATRSSEGRFQWRQVQSNENSATISDSAPVAHLDRAPAF